MQNLDFTPQRDPHMWITTIYFAGGSSLVVEVIEWRKDTSPNIVRTANGQILYQGINASWSSYPNQYVARAFFQLRQTVLKAEQQEYKEELADSSKADQVQTLSF